MIQVTSDELRPGMILGRSIYRENGELLLAQGFAIEEKVLKKLKTLDYPFFWIQEKNTENIVPSQIISDHLALQGQAALRENADLVRKMLNIQNKTIEEIDLAMADTTKFKNVLIASRVKKTVNAIIDDIMNQNAALINLSAIRTKGNYLYQHAIDVTVTAIILANKLHFNRQEVEELAMGCMLMDFGMVFIPDEITSKTSRLTFQEYTILKEHTTYGYSVLRENDQIPLNAIHVAYQHHERQDGAGYPRGLRGKNDFPIKRLSVDRGSIHRYAEIASVVDTYVALISSRPQFNNVPRTPEQAIRTLMTAAGSQLNKTIVDTLIAMIPIYPVGMRISVVHDPKYNLEGHTGIVARYRQESPDKPTIMIMFNREKEKIKPILIDLLDEPEMKIQFVVLG